MWLTNLRNSYFVFRLEIAKSASQLGKETFQKIKELSSFNSILSRDVSILRKADFILNFALLLFRNN